MRAVVQRVLNGAVTVEGNVVGEIGRGIVVLVGIHKDDNEENMNYIVRKLLSLRLWPSEDGEKSWDRNVVQIGGGILLVSQFTLMHTLKGNKPDFHMAMKPEEAKVLFNNLRDALSRNYSPDKVSTGQFQSYMNIKMTNDGPVTLVLDTEVRK
ncbi:putative D Tyr tRNA(Tyr) deacylase [Trypanosoma vivax]|uniref:D-aminoacyl-tRNA deacylase n=1 Tax=Trypanosoma vivax (strain Y486) TaxID=1055687 RepID=G0U6Z9_TRYVY|nr:putative D-tyrosyl-tRNA deacylase [Trypanosoma vivax]KAH8611350.1 putative D Tyr tRNA(Tyr) deacylase [Trypanosoma vivax]CCC51656.1 putative D-tyrosyl-tRNA deacylase [Trypanosoma vivax Y486]